jgi:hypothetical protein
MAALASAMIVFRKGSPGNAEPAISDAQLTAGAKVADESSQGS